VVAMAVFRKSDSCRDNPLARRSRSAERGLAAPLLPAGIKGTAIVFSAGSGQVAMFLSNAGKPL
jgi:hypothetical protein